MQINCQLIDLMNDVLEILFQTPIKIVLKF